MIQIDNVVVSLDVLRENLCATWMPVKVSVHRRDAGAPVN